MLQRLTLATLSDGAGPAPRLAPVFDRSLRSGFESEKPGPITLELKFSEAQLIQSLRLFAGDQPLSWAVATASNTADLRSGAGTYRLIAESRKAERGVTDSEIKLAQPISVTALRITVSPEAEGGRVLIRELNILADQSLQALSISAPSTLAPLGGACR